MVDPSSVPTDVLAVPVLPVMVAPEPTVSVTRDTAHLVRGILVLVVVTGTADHPAGNIVTLCLDFHQTIDIFIVELGSMVETLN